MYRKQFNFRMIVSCNVLINFRAKLGCPVDAGRLDGESSKAVGCLVDCTTDAIQPSIKPSTNIFFGWSAGCGSRKSHFERRTGKVRRRAD